MPVNYSFAGKKVLITGGASGIGRQLAHQFNSDGATVFVVDINKDAVEKLQNELPNVMAHVLDISDWKSARAVIESFGVLDHLVNNAAVYKGQSFMEITEEDALFQYNVNVGGIINITQAVAKGMIQSKSGGTIVNISSAAAKKYVPGLACYSASKAAVTMLTKSMAVELGAHNIRVNCIQPGTVDTPIIRLPDGTIFPGATQAMEQTVMKRFIQPSEVADLAMFLLSPLSSMITGEAVNIDGCYL